MNLIDEAEIKKSDNDQNKAQKKLILLVVGIAVLIVLAVLVVLYKKNVINSQFKFYIDGKTTSTTNIFRTASDNTFVTDKDATGKTIYYLSVRDFANKMTGYTAYTGLPDSYIEHDYSNCYIERQSYERVIFTVGKEYIVKYEFLNNNKIVEIPISFKIYSEGDKIYAPSDAIEKAFNCRITYNAENNSFSVKSLSYLVQAYNKSYPLSAVSGSVNSSNSKPSYTEFQNQKAVLRGYLVVKDPANGKLGVLNLNDSKATKDFKGAKTIKNADSLAIGLKYSEIRFIEDSETFYVKTTDKKVGILKKDGTSIINPVYLSIDSMGAGTDLYVAQSETGRYGVIDRNQNNVIPFDYDRIGIKDTYNDPNVANKYLLLDFYIPAYNESEGYTFFSVGGERLVSNQTFKSIGCNSNAGTGTRGVVIIPDLNAIVISYNEPVTGKDGRTTTATFYAIIGDYYATDGKVNKLETIAVHFTQIYAKEVSGKITYMAVQEGTTVDVVQLVNDYYSKLQQGGEPAEQTDTGNEGGEESGENNQENQEASEG